VHLRPRLYFLLTRYVPRIDHYPLVCGMLWKPTWKSTPTMSWYNQLVARSGDAAGRPLKKLSRYRSIFTCCFAEIASFSWLVQFVHAYGEQASQGILWAPFTRFAFDSYNKIITGLSLDWFEMRVGPHLPTPSQMGIPAIPGKLGSACTGAGKRRLFAIGNYVNQRLFTNG
jgi:hypothetical protein